MTSSGPRIAARDLHVSHSGADGGLPVIDGLDLDVAPGEFIALVGPSGCGKSTLLDVLAGLTLPDRGGVAVDDRPVRTGDLALMPQTDALLPWKTLAENVALGARMGAGGDVRSSIDRFGLAGFDDHFPHALSGGMRQRAALARTLASGRRGWLLDEPFGALDALTRADVRAELRATWQEHAPTVVLVTHDIEEAVVLADRVLVSGPRPMGALGEVVLGRAATRTPAEVAEARAAVADVLARLSDRPMTT